MIAKEQTKVMLEISDKVLEVIDNADQFPRGDLQGVIEAIILQAINEGKRLERMYQLEQKRLAE